MYDDEEKENNCQDNSNPSKRAKTDCGKTKKATSRKMLAKTVKMRIMEHISSLNPTAIATLSISEVSHSLPDREAHLRKVCENIVPSTTAFYVKHLRELYEVFYYECSSMKDRYLHFQLKWHNHCSLFLLERNQV